MQPTHRDSEKEKREATKSRGEARRVRGDHQSRIRLQIICLGVNSGSVALFLPPAAVVTREEVGGGRGEEEAW